MNQCILCLWHADRPDKKGLIGPFKDKHEAGDWFVDNKLGDSGLVYVVNEITTPLEALKSISLAQQEN